MLKDKGRVKHDKTQYELNRMVRGNWNGVNPVTRVEDNKKSYNRKKQKKSFYDEDDD